MIDENVNRFCELVLEINSANKKLNFERRTFYDGGHSFEECCKNDILELSNLQSELKQILRKIS